MASLSSCFELGHVADAIDEFSVQPPILVRAQLDDLALKVKLWLETGAVEIQINWNSTVLRESYIGQRREKLVDEDVSIQVDRLLIPGIVVRDIGLRGSCVGIFCSPWEEIE